MVYYNLEGDWCINKTHGYYPEFEKAVLVAEGGFFILLPLFKRSKILILN